MVGESGGRGERVVEMPLFGNDSLLPERLGVQIFRGEGRSVQDISPPTRVSASISYCQTFREPQTKCLIIFMSG